MLEGKMGIEENYPKSAAPKSVTSYPPAQDLTHSVLINFVKSVPSTEMLWSPTDAMPLTTGMILFGKEHAFFTKEPVPSSNSVSFHEELFMVCFLAGVYWE